MRHFTLRAAIVSLAVASIATGVLEAQSAPASNNAAAPSTRAATPAKVAIPTEITIQREVFDYSSSGRRDPYRSLMTTSDVRPLLSDLQLTVVVLDPAGGNSVAFLKDEFSKTKYRVKVGQQLGRLRVSAIKQKEIQFTVEEFGFNRIETLSRSSDTTKVRNQ